MQRAGQAFKAQGFEAPRQEARALVQALIGWDLARQLAHPHDPLSGEEVTLLDGALEMRLDHQPLAQIAGEITFDGLLFKISPQVLIPRPETELLVAEAFEWARGLEKKDEPLVLLDTFTGSGAVGISLGRRLEKAGLAFDLTLADLSEAALDLARINAGLHLPQARTRFCLSDIWPQAAGPYDLITANPPYIARGDLAQLMPDVRLYEPRLALDGGEDGLDFYRRLALEGTVYLVPGGLLLLELGAGQADGVQGLFQDRGWQLDRQVRDWAGHMRLLGFRRPIVN